MLFSPVTSELQFCMGEHSFGILNKPLPEFDRSAVFLLYAANLGDVAKTAFAVGLDPVQLLRVADEEGWNKKLEPILEKIKSQRPQEFERGLNRCINFVQAFRFRQILERTIKLMTGWSDAELVEYLTPESVSKAGVCSRKLSTRALADAASALEKAHSLTYQALGDTASERIKRPPADDSGGSALDLHAKIAAALGSVSASKSPRALLLDAQIEQAEEAKKLALIPKKPVDDDYVDESGG